MEKNTGIKFNLESGFPAFGRRQDKADELMLLMRERDASSSKKTLRAFLKEKTAKVSAKKSKEMG